MKNTFTHLQFLIFLIIISAGNAVAQKMPFQGRLMENGKPFSGTVNIVFEIDSLNWTETHSNVLVSEGLYSVELGNGKPLPSILFAGADSRMLSISINGTALDPVPLYPALTKNNHTVIVDENSPGTDALSYTITGKGKAGSLYRPIVGTASAENGVNIGVTGIGISKAGNAAGIQGFWARVSGEGTGLHIGTLSEAISAQDSRNTHYGAWGRSYGNGTGQHIGLFGQGYGKGINYGVVASAFGEGLWNIGIRSIANGSGNGATGFSEGSYNKGIVAIARGNSWGNVGVDGRAENDPSLGGKGVDNIGVFGLSSVNDASTTISNTGVMGIARGPGRNVGVMGNAHSGSDNWAGWFNGDVSIHGNLVMNGTIQNLNTSRIGLGSPELANLVAIENTNGGYKGAQLNFSGGISPEGNYMLGGASIGNKFWEQKGYLGYVHVNGNDPNRHNVGRFEARNHGGPDHGYLEVINTENNSRVILNGHPGEVLVFGPDSPNFLLQPQHWLNNNLPILNLYGNEPNGHGWFHSHVELAVDFKNSQHYGNMSLKGPDNKTNIWMGAKHWEGADGVKLPFFVLNGKTNLGRLNMSVVTGENNYESGILFIEDSEKAYMHLRAGSLQLSKESSSSGIRIYSQFEDQSHIALDGANGNHIFLWGNGSIQATGVVSASGFNQYSDAALKTNINPLENTLSNVIKLRGVSYNWIDTLKPQEKQIGFIAQQVEEVYPEFVITRDDGIKTVNYAQMASVLVESIKELHNRIARLEEQNLQLASQLASQQQLTQEIALLKTLMMDILAKNAGLEMPSATSENISGH
jgi:hypothetical protein